MSTYKTTEANFKRSIERLLTSFHGSTGFDVRTESHQPAINVIGLTFASAELALTYLDTPCENRIARAVLGRAILEFSTRALWLARNGTPGLDAMHWYHQKKIHQYATALAGEDLSAFPELRKEVDEAIAEGKAPSPPPLGGQAEHVDQMMNSLDAGTGLYVMYRGFCQYAHPTLGASGSYVRTSPAGQASFERVSNAPFDDTNLKTVMTPLVFAFDAADLSIVGSPFQQQLDTLHKQLGITETSPKDHS